MNKSLPTPKSDLEAEKRLEMEYAESAVQDRIINAEFECALMDGLEDESW